MSDILIHMAQNGVATLTINRPQRHNAFDDNIIRQLQQALDHCNGNRDIRVVILTAAGPTFCSGADIQWIEKIATYSIEENYNDALQMSICFLTLATLSKPTIAVVQGPAYGGGVGLIAACDICIADEQASFCLPEVKLGLIPAVVSPYINRTMGKRAARRYYLTGERFSADQAMLLGLVHSVVATDQLQNEADSFCNRLLKNGPQAMAAVKSRLTTYEKPTVEDISKYTAQCIADTRSSPEGREGISAFLQKRPPVWIAQQDKNNN